MKKTLIPVVAVAVAALLVPAPRAHAVAKEIIQLQTQVQQLQDMVQHLQDTNAAHFAVIQQLVQTTANNVANMTHTINGLQQQISNNEQNNNNQLSGQIQNLNDAVDVLKTRVEQMDRTLHSIQSQLQNVQAQPTATQPPCVPTATQPCPPPPTPGAPGTAVMQQQAPPVQQLYQSALTDYNGARYDLAAGEFSQVIQAYPQDPLAARSQFYLGEIAFHQKNYDTAIKNYEQVLQQFPGSAKAPSAQLRMGEADEVTGRRQAAINNFRALIARYPQTPEAQTARLRLREMRVSVTARKPSAYR